MSIERPETSKPVADGESERPELRGSPAALLFPIALTVALVTAAFLWWGQDAALEIVLVSVAAVTVAGKFIVARGLASGGFFDSPWKLVPVIVYFDCLVALIAVFNVGILYRIPKVGARLAELRRTGARILDRNPWMRKMTFLGIIAFVMFPLSGTGAIGGAFFGQLLGMSRLRTFIGIAIGSILGGVAMAALAEAMGESFARLQENPILLIGGALVIAALVWWLLRRSRAAT